MYFASFWGCPPALQTTMFFQLAHGLSKYPAFNLNFGHLFAPNPEQITRQVRAEVTFDDGYSKIWRYGPKPMILNSMVAWRWHYLLNRKMVLKYKNYIKLPEVWTGVAQFVARKSNTSKHQPASIRIIETVQSIPPYGLLSLQNTKVTHKLLFAYNVCSKDLR
jgi:hypothetical protein